MALVALIIALLLEQWRPLTDRRGLFEPVVRYAELLERHFNAGEARHGRIAWLIAVVPPVLAAWALHALLYRASPLLAVAFDVAVLYFTMGFRQFSHFFTGIQLALSQDDLPRARDLLGQWCRRDCAELSREEVVRLAIEEALVASHRHVFAVIFWFVLLPGPSGAVLYRLSTWLARQWGGPPGTETERFGQFARRAFALLDRVAAWFSATAFAVVGDFEDAVYCLRTQASRWIDPSLGIVLAAGAGAIGVRLGGPFVRDGVLVDRPEIGAGDEADVSYLDSTVGLVWRALVLWLLILLLIGIAAAVS